VHRTSAGLLALSMWAALGHAAGVLPQHGPRRGRVQRSGGWGDRGGSDLRELRQGRAGAKAEPRGLRPL